MSRQTKLLLALMVPILMMVGIGFIIFQTQQDQAPESASALFDDACKELEMNCNSGTGKIERIFSSEENATQINGKTIPPGGSKSFDIGNGKFTGSIKVDFISRAGRPITLNEVALGIFGPQASDPGSTPILKPVHKYVDKKSQLIPESGRFSIQRSGSFTISECGWYQIDIINTKCGGGNCDPGGRIFRVTGCDGGGGGGGNLGCRDACSSESDCRTDWFTFIDLSCVNGKCINPACAESQQDRNCYCSKGCGEICGPTAQAKTGVHSICDGAKDAYGNRLGCRLLAPSSGDCNFYCMPGVNVTQVTGGRCGYDGYSQTSIPSFNALMTEYCEPRVEQVCGDSTCNQSYETCDGNVDCVGGDFSAGECRPAGSASECTFCGDGIIQDELEECEMGQICSNGETCDDDCTCPVIIQEGDLTLVKRSTASCGQLNETNVIDYVITLSNVGDGDATYDEIVDTIDVDPALVTVSNISNDGVFFADNGITSIIWPGGSLAPSESLELTYTVTVPLETAELMSYLIENEVEVSADTDTTLTVDNTQTMTPCDQPVDPYRGDLPRTALKDDLMYITAFVLFLLAVVAYKKGIGQEYSKIIVNNLGLGIKKSIHKAHITINPEARIKDYENRVERDSRK